MRIYQVDAFTQTPFTGNPAGVCITDDPLEEGLMQRIAEEMRLPETAFVVPTGEARYSIRWFTPATEVDLCGHATLASAHILYEEKGVPSTAALTFSSRSGELFVRNSNSGIVLDFPGEAPSEAALPETVAAGLGLPVLYSGKNRMDWIVETESDSALRDYTPPLDLLATLGDRGIMITAKDSSGEYDFISRFFAPGIGIPEDPVTGSSHCCLGPYWGGKLGKEKLKAYQASPRGGGMEVFIRGDRVELTGRAVTVLKGDLFTAKA